MIPQALPRCFPGVAPVVDTGVAPGGKIFLPDLLWIIVFALIRDDDYDDNVDAGENDDDDDAIDAGEDERVQQLFTNPSKATIRRLLQG